jgi:hypothetical protein
MPRRQDSDIDEGLVGWTHAAAKGAADREFEG